MANIQSNVVGAIGSIGQLSKLGEIAANQREDLKMKQQDKARRAAVNSLLSSSISKDDQAWIKAELEGRWANKDLGGIGQKVADDLDETAALRKIREGDIPAELRGSKDLDEKWGYKHGEWMPNATIERRSMLTDMLMAYSEGKIDEGNAIGKSLQDINAKEFAKYEEIMKDKKKGGNR